MVRPSQEANRTFSNLRARLKEARLALRLTQDQLAAKWGLKSGANYIWMIEKGRKPFPPKHTGRLEQLEREAAALSGSNPPASSAPAAQPAGPEAWRRRALAAEKKLADLRSVLEALLDLSGSGAEAGLGEPVGSDKARIASALRAAVSRTPRPSGPKSGPTPGKSGPPSGSGPRSSGLSRPRVQDPGSK